MEYRRERLQTTWKDGRLTGIIIPSGINLAKSYLSIPAEVLLDPKTDIDRELRRFWLELYSNTFSSKPPPHFQKCLNPNIRKIPDVLVIPKSGDFYTGVQYKIGKMGGRAWVGIHDFFPGFGPRFKVFGLLDRVGKRDRRPN